MKEKKRKAGEPSFIIDKLEKNLRRAGCNIFYFITLYVIVSDMTTSF